ncbi:conserved hypothetical protein [Trichinella spiralis]|uniref:hypothetical protein n=1 Tax=Trichinella spiralis TaxID=6334 RepID=UPI0001EFBFC9|nr:conserved hypothetical protein [Trichinella spiralis]
MKSRHSKTCMKGRKGMQIFDRLQCSRLRCLNGCWRTVSRASALAWNCKIEINLKRFSSNFTENLKVNETLKKQWKCKMNRMLFKMNRKLGKISQLETTDS